MAVSTRRKKFIRNPDRVEEVTLKAMERIRAKRGNVDQFRAGITEIVESVDRRGGAAIPSRASVYRALERMAEKGVFQITRRGERGNYTYNFAGAATPESVTATSPEPRVKRVYRKRVAAATVETPVGQAASAQPVHANDLQSLIREDQSLDAMIESRKAELLARIEQKRAALATLEASLAPEKEMVAA